MRAAFLVIKIVYIVAVMLIFDVNVPYNINNNES